MHFVLATSNPGKLGEFQHLLEPLAVRLSPQSAFVTETPAETGWSFVENAILKARFAARHAGLPAIADDSGLEVDALHGAPGIYSARYAGEGANDADNLQKLINALREVPDEQRTARYRCALVFMRWDTDPAPIVCQASWEGRIIGEPRGSGGFGYDPIFELTERKMTAAELTPALKNELSHRGQALRQLVAELERGVHIEPRDALLDRSERESHL